MRLILHYIRKHLGVFLLSMFFLCVEAMADLLQPAYMASIVDSGVKNADIQAIGKYGLIMLLIAGAGALGAVARNIFSSYTSQVIGKELSRDIYTKVQSLSLENIDQLRPSSIITRITNDVTRIQMFVSGSMRIMIKAPITCVGAIVLIILQTPKQLPMIGTVLAIAAIFILANAFLGYPRFERRQRKLDRLNDVSREFLSSIRVVKAFNAENREEEKFSRASGELSEANVSADRVTAVFSPLINLTVNMGIVALLWISRRQDSSMIGHLMASVNYMTQIHFALNMVSSILNTATWAMASSGRISEILDAVPAQKNPVNPLKPKFEGEVAFEDVTFAYAGAEKESVSHISFRVEKGETIGVIGPTGAGKTTIVNLIPRLYDATKGRVLIDGLDVTKLDTRALRGAVAMVPQRATLFTGTIAENLRWGNKEASDAEIRQAASAARADLFIDSFKDGYATRLGQGGVNLSGGQKQRLAIARALLCHPKILILDDCTSALDASTEAEVLNALKTLSADMTVFLISQRISTVSRSDRILCMEDGEIMGYGEKEELLRSCATYQALYQSRIGGESHVC